MGILLNTACTLLLEHMRRPFQGSMLVLGKQDVYLSWESLQYIAMKMGAILKCLPENEIELSRKIWHIPNKYITDTTFFKALGFSEVVSMDCSGYEGAELIQDLNHIVPEKYFEGYDAIFDGGTCEHIFHIPNFLTSVCLMLRVNGRIIHDNPSAGLIDHGFYSISPTLYYDFYNANGFEINKLSVFKQDKDLMISSLFEEREYHAGEYDYHKCYLPDNKLYCTTCIATKLKAFENCRYPQQSIWSRTEGIGSGK
jgi:hypothetical protein